MCGIVGYIGPQSVVPVIIEGLRRLEYRGYDSAGIAVAGGPEGLALRRAPGKLRNLENLTPATPNPSSPTPPSPAPSGPATPAGPPTAAPPKKTPTPTATAPAPSSSST